MNREQLEEVLSETLLWEVISENVENVNQLPIMLQDINYLENKNSVIAIIDECEVLISDSFDIIKSETHGENILISFEMPFVMSAWSTTKQHLRITATATGKCMIPSIEIYDWDSIDFESMRKEELLENQNLVDILELNYAWVECDDVSIL